nr:immunoglobulin heavy chain junction region [Mus musculus]MBK4188947.1 immunoglobulin heavy chain junction region [Mus musculus]MBK4188948.1 immunoglobulin heavy chain junction region [Mus musculus]MBK4188949.1 immunoglobulin heavy chain junction region [Mus musculus]MBK4188950.1 immunoglobulin heavy chain junction region [Mus musculus]
CVREIGIYYGNYVGYFDYW